MNNNNKNMNNNNKNMNNSDNVEFNNFLIEHKINLKDYYYEKNKYKYYDVESDQQIYNIIRSELSYVNKFLLLTSLFMPYDKRDINNMYKLLKIIENKYDKEIYNLFKKMFKKKVNYVYTKQNMFDKVINKISGKIINKTIENYLDIGCGDLSKTIIFGEACKANNIIGIDIEKWSNFDDTNRKFNNNVKFVSIKENESFADKFDIKFDIITSFMVLHHVKKLDILLSQISKLLKDDGIFIIKEHDIVNNIDRMLTDIQHIYYDGILFNNENYISTYFAKYMDRYELEYILRKYGFKMLFMFYESNTISFNIHPTNYYFCAFVKK